MRSIRSSLVVTLIAAFTLVSFLAVLMGYRASMDRAEELLDAQLQYVATILRSTVPAAAPAAPVATDGLAFQVWREGRLLLQSEGLPSEPLAEFEPGYAYANFSGYRWRTLSVAEAGDTWFLVAERADLRYTMAEGVVLESVMPLLTWLPVAAVATWILVGWGLQPLRTLSEQINRKASDDLSPLDFPDPPGELGPVIASTNALLSRLASALRREKDFASHAAHELRTPLSGLKVHLHNLAGEIVDPPPSLAHMRSDLERMQHLVEQVLDLARTQPELMPARFKTFDLHALAERVTAALWPDFDGAGLSLSLTGERALIGGDEGMVETLLRNLLDNARKYGAGGEVEVSVVARDRGAQLRVSDQGPGIAAADRQRVFERFYRGAVGSGGGAPGAGLGLAIVLQIVEVHGARIDLEESPGGHGLSVVVTFADGAKR